MNLRVYPGPLHGEVERVIPSKSQLHRALICAALAKRPVTVQNAALCRDVQATACCLRALGAKIGRRGDCLRVTPIPAKAHQGALLDCGESGSTLRFLLPLAAALGVECAFTGRGRLAERPLSPLREAMEANGARLSAAGAFPLRCAGRLRPGAYDLRGGASSQFVSGLLMALPLLAGDSEIRVSGDLPSRPYVDMTLDMLIAFSVVVLETKAGFRVPGGQRYAGPECFSPEADWSAAAFWLAAGALSEKGVACAGLNPDSRQGDRAILTMLRRFGAEVAVDGSRVTARRGALRGADWDAADTPDLAPVWTVLAAAAVGESRISHIQRLRLKESDRVAGIAAMARALGAEAEAQADALIIRGRGRLRGAVIDAQGDHRLAMAAAIAAGAAEGPVVIRGAEAADKSYPGFFEALAALGGRAEEAQDAV